MATASIKLKGRIYHRLRSIRRWDESNPSFRLALPPLSKSATVQRLSQNDSECPAPSARSWEFCAFLASHQISAGFAAFWWPSRHWNEFGIPILPRAQVQASSCFTSFSFALGPLGAPGNQRNTVLKLGARASPQKPSSQARWGFRGCHLFVRGRPPRHRT